MRRLPLLLILAGLAGCYVPVSLPEVMVALQRPPRKEEFADVGRYEEKMIPGIMYYHYARVAYSRYEKLVDQQRNRRKQASDDKYAKMQEKYLEQKKLEHLAETQKGLKKFLEINRAHEAVAQDEQKESISSAEVKKYVAKAHQRLGVIHFERKEYKLALAEFEEVLTIYPQADNAWVNMGLCYWRQGKRQKAKDAIAQALKLNPESRKARQARDAIEEEERRKAAREPQE